jgi:rhodanese-related sulfurtransferase
VTLLDLSQLRQALDVTTQDLFRWETLPAYEVASDGSDYRRYLDGADAPTPERKQPWLIPCAHGLIKDDIGGG